MAKKILIVDDEPDMVDWLEAFFEDNGYETIHAHNGVDGTELARTGNPDLITLDISMDKQSGIKMFRTVQDDADLKKIPVIMITGVSPELKGFIDRTKKVDPPAAFFEKPVDREALLAKVKELIG